MFFWFRILGFPSFEIGEIGEKESWDSGFNAD